MSNVYRYSQLSPEARRAFNKRHHKKRREYYRRREAERSLVRVFINAHPEEVEVIRRKHERSSR